MGDSIAHVRQAIKQSTNSATTLVTTKVNLQRISQFTVRRLLSISGFPDDDLVSQSLPHLKLFQSTRIVSQDDVRCAENRHEFEKLRETRSN